MADVIAYPERVGEGAKSEGWRIWVVAASSDDGPAVWSLATADGGVLTTTCSPTNLLGAVMQFIGARSVNAKE